LDKLKESNAGEHPGLTEAVRLIVQVLESPSVQRTKDPFADLAGGGWLCCRLLAETI
jgi:hypothetical protein